MASFCSTAAMSPTHLSTQERNIAQVFQFPVIYDTMTVYDNLAFPLRNRGVAEAAVDAKVREIAAMLDLGDMLKRRASGLTADGKQKISLGRGLVLDLTIWHGNSGGGLFDAKGRLVGITTAIFGRRTMTSRVYSGFSFAISGLEVCAFAKRFE